MDWINIFRVGMVSLTTLGLMIVLFLNWKMIKFSKRYSAKWSHSWVVFFVAMCVILLRRGIALMWGSGVDGQFLKILSWVDYIGVATACTFLYLAFLYTNWHWWNDFFKQYMTLTKRETDVAQREADVTQREEEIASLEVTSPNGVDVDEPKQVVVSLDEKKVVVTQPKKVLLTKPKEVKIIKHGE